MRSLQKWTEPRGLVEARRRLEPAPRETLVKSLSSALVLSAPAGFTEGDRRAWLAAAAVTLQGIPADLLELGVAAARRTADHPSRIVPTIMTEVQEAWNRRRQAYRDERAYAAPEDEIEPCTPEQAAEILAEFGLPSLNVKIGSKAGDLEHG